MRKTSLAQLFGGRGKFIKTVRLNISKVKRIHKEHLKKREKIQKKTC